MFQFVFVVFFLNNQSTFAYDFSVIKVIEYLLQDNCYVYEKIENCDAEKLLNMRIFKNIFYKLQIK